MGTPQVPGMSDCLAPPPRWPRHGASKVVQRVNGKTLQGFVCDQARTNGMESFWSILKRAHDGTLHKISPKHLQWYVSEFARKHNHRESGTLVQMRDTVARLVGRNLLYRDLIADNGLSSGSGA